MPLASSDFAALTVRHAYILHPRLQLVTSGTEITRTHHPLGTVVMVPAAGVLLVNGENMVRNKNGKQAKGQEIPQTRHRPSQGGT